MNDFILIFMGIFIILLIVLVFLLLAYVYNSYTTYKVDINKKIVIIESNIDETSKTYNNLEENIISKFAKNNKNQEIMVTTIPNNLISINSNILNMFEPINDSNVVNTDITKNNITINGINVIKPFTSYKNLTSITDANNSFNICNTNIDASKRSCIKMNIENNNFNFYTSNANSTNMINIYDSNNGILASFDTYNKNISLGSDINPAISIKNNVYNPDIIVCKYKISIFGGIFNELKITLISNKTITSDKIINIPIINNFTITPGGMIFVGAPVNAIITLLNYNDNVLKFNLKFNLKPSLLANTIFEFTIYVDVKPGTTINPETVTTTGYISAT